MRCRLSSQLLRDELIAPEETLSVRLGETLCTVHQLLTLQRAKDAARFLAELTKRGFRLDEHHAPGLGAGFLRIVMMTEDAPVPTSAAKARGGRAFAFWSRVLRGLPPFTFGRLQTRLLRGSGFRMGKTSNLWSLPTFSGPLSPLEALSLGEAVGVNAGCHFELYASITLEDDVSVGHDVLFVTRAFERRERLGPTFSAKPIVVRRGAWIGARATVLPGVTIGEGAVVGAQVVVTKDVPPHTMITGKRQLSLAKWR